MLRERQNASQDERERAHFSNFMLAQIQSMEKFRQALARHTGCEITSEQAAFMWIEQGCAAAFRQRFGTA